MCQAALWKNYFSLTFPANKLFQTRIKIYINVSNIQEHYSIIYIQTYGVGGGRKETPLTSK